MNQTLAKHFESLSGKEFKWYYSHKVLGDYVMTASLEYVYISLDGRDDMESVICEYFYLVTCDGVEVHKGTLLFEVFNENHFPILQDFASNWIANVSKIAMSMEFVSCIEPQTTNLRLV